MALLIQRIELDRFRNWERMTIEPGPGLTVICGPNAAGKTNIVEAVELLTTGRSFRRPKWADVVREGSADSVITMVAGGGGRVREVAIGFSAESRRSVVVNGTKKRGSRDILGAIPSVLFTPDDLGLVKDSADRRRSEIDELGEQLSATYADIRAQFDRALRQRNALLKQDVVDEGILEAWTHRFVELGAALSVHRVRLFGRLRPAIEREYGTISAGEVLKAEYSSAFWSANVETSREEVAEQLSLRLEERAGDERARRITLAGPHRDDVIFTVDGREARAMASQGQQRTIALAWKLAEVKVVEDVSGSRPILLLDDVMSELDATRREQLSEAVVGTAQAIVTTTNLGYFSESTLQDAKVISIGD